MQLTSPAFVHQGAIPVKYTCEGDDLSPELSWADVPTGTQSLALICDDPDAPGGTWVHWVLFNVPPEIAGLPEGMDATTSMRGAGGKNSWGELVYGGPCPPSGTHRYFFRLYALDTPLGLEAGATKMALLKAMEGHVLAQAELMGTYQISAR